MKSWGIGDLPSLSTSSIYESGCKLQGTEELALCCGERKKNERETKHSVAPGAPLPVLASEVRPPTPAHGAVLLRVPTTPPQREPGSSLSFHLLL